MALRNNLPSPAATASDPPASGRVTSVVKPKTRLRRNTRLCLKTLYDGLPRPSGVSKYVGFDGLGRPSYVPDPCFETKPSWTAPLWDVNNEVTLFGTVV